MSKNNSDEQLLKEIQYLSEQIKQLRRNLAEFSSSCNRSENQYQSIYELISKMFLSDQQLYNKQSWLERIYDHIYILNNDSKYYYQVQENFFEVINFLSPPTNMNVDSNMFQSVFNPEIRINQHTFYNFHNNYWPYHLNRILFGNPSIQNSQYQLYLNQYQNFFQRQNQNFSSGIMVLELHEFFLICFVAGLSKMKSRNMNEVSNLSANMYINQSFQGMTHNPFLILLQSYLQTLKGTTLQLFYFLLQEYLVVEKITVFNQFDFMQEIFAYIETGQQQLAQQQQQYGILKKSSLAKSSIQNIGQLNQRSQIFGKQSGIYNNASSANNNGQQQQQIYQVPAKEFKVPEPHIFYALQIIIHAKGGANIHRDDTFRRQIFKLIFCSLEIKEFTQRISSLNDITKLYLQFIFPVSSIFNIPIENAIKVNRTNLNNFIEIKSSKIKQLAQQFTKSFIKTVEFDQTQPYEQEEMYFIQNPAKNNNNIQNQSNKYYDEFYNYFHIQRKSESVIDTKHHQDQNILFYTILFNRYITLYSQLKAPSSQDMFALFHFMQVFQVNQDSDKNLNLLFGLVSGHKLQENDQSINSNNISINNGSYYSSQINQRIHNGSFADTQYQQQQRKTRSNQDQPTFDALWNSLQVMYFDKIDGRIFDNFLVFGNTSMRDVYGKIALNIEQQFKQIGIQTQNYQNQNQKKQINNENYAAFITVLMNNILPELKSNFDNFCMQYNFNIKNNNLDSSLLNQSNRQKDSYFNKFSSNISNNSYMQNYSNVNEYQQYQSQQYQQDQNIRQQQYIENVGIKNQHYVYNYLTWDLPCQAHEIFLLYNLFYWICFQLSSIPFLRSQPLKKITIKQKEIEVPGFGWMRVLCKKQSWFVIFGLVLILMLLYYFISTFWGVMSNFANSGSQKRNQQRRQQYNY